MNRTTRQGHREPQEPAPIDNPGPRRGRRVGVAIALGLTAAVVVVAALGLGGRHRDVARTQVALRSVTVARCTLTDSQTFTARTTFGAAIALPLQTQGLITWLPRSGTVVKQGHALARVNDRPVVLLYGSLPQYRTLHAPSVHTTTDIETAQRADGASRQKKAGDAPATSTTTKTTTRTTTRTTTDPPMRGADVRELTHALVNLGYNDPGTGDRYTRATAEVVKAWQHDLGENPTGTVELGDVFFAAGPVRVVPGDDGAVGQPMSPTALARTSRTRAVVATVPDSSTWARPGAMLTVDVGATSVPAVIATVDQAESTSSDGGQNLEVLARVANQNSLDGAGPSLAATHVSARRAGVLCVPSAALVALAEGGYGLQTPAGRYLAVRTGLFAQGKVEVSGSSIGAGSAVTMPAGD